MKGGDKIQGVLDKRIESCYNGIMIIEHKPFTQTFRPGNQQKGEQLWQENWKVLQS